MGQMNGYNHVSVSYKNSLDLYNLDGQKEMNYDSGIFPWWSWFKVGLIESL